MLIKFESIAAGVGGINTVSCTKDVKNFEGV